MKRGAVVRCGLGKQHAAFHEPVLGTWQQHAPLPPKRGQGHRGEGTRVKGKGGTAGSAAGREGMYTTYTPALMHPHPHIYFE